MNDSPNTTCVIHLGNFVWSPINWKCSPISFLGLFMDISGRLKSCRFQVTKIKIEKWNKITWITLFIEFYSDPFHLFLRWVVVLLHFFFECWQMVAESFNERFIMQHHWAFITGSKPAVSLSLTGSGSLPSTLISRVPVLLPKNNSRSRHFSILRSKYFSIFVKSASISSIWRI